MWEVMEKYGRRRKRWFGRGKDDGMRWKSERGHVEHLSPFKFKLPKTTGVVNCLIGEKRTSDRMWR
jgi:hypothetical protein